MTAIDGPVITRRNAGKLLAGLYLAGLTARTQALSFTQQLAAPGPLDDLPPWAQQQSQFRRSALLIGLGSYQHVGPLPTPPFDVPLMHQALGRLNFSVTAFSNVACDACRLRAEIDTFTAGLGDGDLALIYFSGHGVSRNGLNFLVPTTGRPVSGQMAGYEYVSLDYVQRSAAASNAGLTLIFLDACRNDPFEGQPVEYVGGDDDAPEDQSNPLICRAVPATPTLAAVAAANQIDQNVAALAADMADAAVTSSSGLATVANLPTSIFVGFASAPNKPAETLLPGETPEKGSLYTRALADALQPKRSLGWIVNETKGIMAGLGVSQVPSIASDHGCTVMLQEDDHFLEDEISSWIRHIRRSQIGPNGIRTQSQQEAAELTTFLSHFPVGRFSVTARNRLRAIQKGTGQAQERNVAKMPVRELFTGSASSPSAFGMFAAPGGLTLNGGQKLFAKPRKSKRRDNFVSELSAGSGVDVQKVLPGNWALVVTDDGLEGYLPNIVRHKLAGKMVMVQFAGDQPDAGYGSQEAIEQIARDAIDDKDSLVIRVGTPNSVDPGLALRTAYMRSLALSEVIERLGLSSDRITLISGTASGLPSNQAQLTLVRI